MYVKHAALATVVTLLACGWGLAEEAVEPVFEPYVGEVAVDVLNVRSGPSTNYYVVTRLHGGHVRVVGEESSWLAVVPPEGCFSLIAAEYVDRGDGVHGVVNGDNVRVRAGSELSSHSYAVQLKLDRGASVKVLGEADEQYLKIEPPAGATLWVSGEHIRRLPQEALDTELAAAESVDSPPGFEAASPVDEAVSEAEVAKGEAVPETESAKAGSESVEQASAAASVPADEYRRRLEALDAELKEELSKPLMRRDYAALLPRFAGLAEQEVDNYTSAYARVRVQQIEAAVTMIDGLRQVRQLREEIRTVRKEALAERANLRPVPVHVGGGFDVEGELRTSALYDSPVGPRRYRLVDPGLTPTRTLGYVEIPPGADIDIGNYLGRRVGVRTHERILQTGDVNPIAIYVAAELVVLDRTASAKDTPDTPGSVEEETTATAKP